MSVGAIRSLVLLLFAFGLRLREHGRNRTGRQRMRLSEAILLGVRTACELIPFDERR